MFQIKYYSHASISRKILFDIIKVKVIAWPYSYEKQIDWINLNLKDSDIHILLFKDNVLIAYLNLIDIKMEINGIIHKGFGIGNVCVIERGTKWGSILISKTNFFIKKHNKIGLLFCKNLLVDFYKKNNWKVIDNSKLKFSFSQEHIKTMVFNYRCEIKYLVFSEKTF